MLPDLPLGSFQLIAGSGGLPLGPVPVPPGLLQGLAQALGLSLQAGELIGPAQNTGAAAHRAAGHGAAGVQHLAVQGDDLEAVAVLPGHGDGGVHVLRDNSAAQQVGEHPAVFPVKGDKSVAHAHKALLPLHAPVPELGGADGAQGQEGGPSPVPPLEPGDGGLAVLLPFHHDILRGAAQGDLDGHGIRIGHPDEGGHRPPDALELAAPGLSHHQLHRLLVALVAFLQLGEQMDAGAEGSVLHLQLPPALLGLFRPALPGLDPEGMAADDIAQGIPVLSGLLQLGGGGLGLLLQSPEVLLTLGQLPAHRAVPVHQLLGRGGQGGQQGPGLGGRGRVHILPPAQLLQLLGQGAGALGDIGGLLLLPGQSLLPRPGIGQDLLQPLLPLPDLGGDRTGPALLLLQLPADPPGVFQVVLDAAFEHGDGALQPVGVGLAAHHVKSGLLRLHVLLPHLGGELLHPGVERLHRLAGVLLLPDGPLTVGGEAHGGRAQLIQLLQPEGDLQRAHLVPEDEEFLRLLGLLAQRLHLQLQLVDLVPDAHQVLLGALQSALGLLLPVAEAGDAGGLLKDLPAVGALHREDLIYLALADDGIALPAQAGIHKKLVHVLEAHRAAVDVVLALPRAVVPAGDHHLVLRHLEAAVRVVQYQADLGKAQLPAPFRAAENHVLHLSAPEGPGGLLPHHPADGVREIGLARAIGAHDGRDILSEGEHGLIREGFEALDLKRFQIQAGHLSVICPTMGILC